MPRQSTGYLYLQGGSYHLEICKGPRKAREKTYYNLGTADKRVAERRRKDLIAQLAAGKSPAQAARSVPQAMTVAEWAESWNEKRKAQGIASARDDEQRLRDYVLPRIGTMFLPDVRPPHIEAAIDVVVLAGKSRQTVKHVRAAVIRLFKAAWRAELIPENPALKVEMPRVKKTRKPSIQLTDDEFVRLIAYLDERVAAADAWEHEHGREAKRDGSRELRMLCASARILGGMRTSDVNRWDWQQIDVLHFAKVVVPRTKTEEPQELAMPVEIRHIVRDWWERAGRPTSGPVFPARRGANVGGFKAERGISYAARLRRECVRAGLTRRELYIDTPRTRRVDFHSLRGAFTTALANLKEVSMQQAMHLSAHHDPRTHLGYVAKATIIPQGAIPSLITPDNERFPEEIGESGDESSDPARHSGFEPLAFGSGGRRNEHARARKSTRDNGSRVAGVVARDLRSPATTPESPHIPDGEEPPGTAPGVGDRRTPAAADDPSCPPAIRALSQAVGAASVLWDVLEEDAAGAAQDDPDAARAEAELLAEAEAARATCTAIGHEPTIERDYWSQDAWLACKRCGVDLPDEEDASADPTGGAS